MNELEYCQCSREGLKISTADISFGFLYKENADGTKTPVRAGRIHRHCDKPMLDVAYRIIDRKPVPILV